jgi:hypothetical protein
MIGQLSPTGQMLLGQSPGVLPYESEEERKKRLAGLQSSQSSIGRSLGGSPGSLSAAGSALLGTGTIY